MLNEMISHSERSYQLVTERLRTLAEIERTMADVRNKNVETAKDELQLAALDEVFRQLHEMRIDLDQIGRAHV